MKEEMIYYKRRSQEFLTEIIRLNKKIKQEQKRSIKLCDKCKPYQEGIIKGKSLSKQKLHRQ